MHYYQSGLIDENSISGSIHDDSLPVLGILQASNYLLKDGGGAGGGNPALRTQLHSLEASDDAAVGPPAGSGGFPQSQSQSQPLPPSVMQSIQRQQQSRSTFGQLVSLGKVGELPPSAQQPAVNSNSNAAAQTPGANVFDAPEALRNPRYGQL
jgi:hypothetical protein